MCWETLCFSKHKTYQMRKCFHFNFVSLLVSIKRRFYHHIQVSLLLKLLFYDLYFGDLILHPVTSCTEPNNCFDQSKICSWFKLSFFHFSKIEVGKHLKHTTIFLYKCQSSNYQQDCILDSMIIAVSYYFNQQVCTKKCTNRHVTKILISKKTGYISY